MRKRYVQGEILFYLSNGKLHTTRELAENVEVSEMTIRRHISDLSIKFPIVTNKGGIGGGGGIQMNKNGCTFSVFTDRELKIILQGLELMEQEETVLAFTKKIIHIIGN